MSALAPEIQRFIAENISSVAQLEVLLLLRGGREREWTADEVSRTLYAAAGGMHKQLADLVAKGLLSLTSADEDHFQYHPADNEIDAMIGRLADLYRGRRVAVISLIYSEPPDRARSFADAFRIRKEKES